MKNEKPKPNKGFTLDKKKQTETIVARDIIQKDGFYVNQILKDTDAATAANYGTIFTARYACEVQKIQVVYQTASTSGTLQLEKLTGTTAAGSGSNILVAAFDLSATANTVQSKSARELNSSRVLKPGERLALVDAADLSNLNTLVVTIYIVGAGNGHYR